MHFQNLLTALNNRDKRQDRKVVLNAVIKHIEQESYYVKSSFEERNLTFMNVHYIFRDYLVTK